MNANTPITITIDKDGKIHVKMESIVVICKNS